MNKALLTTSILAASTLALSVYAAPQQAEEEAREARSEVDVVRDIDADVRGEILDHRPSPDEAMTLQMAVDAPGRSADNRARDQYRNPAETLEFFEVEPHMTVVEIWPGGGWYTEILAPYLYADGTYYAAHFPSDTDSEYFNQARGRFAEKMQQNAVYNRVQVTSFMPGSHHDIAPAGSADRVLTFRNLHNWYMRDGEEGLQAAFDAFYEALRPGGMLGVVDHRLPEDRDASAAEVSGYIKQSWAEKYAKEAGFELVESSDINANERDTADYEGGVWTLPPTLREGDDNREEYMEIGESDRFTLKFRKPEA